MVTKARQPKAEPVSSKTQYVKHNPHQFFGARCITKEAWASIGIENETTEWNHTNGFCLPAHEFGKDALNYLLNIDDGFEIVSK